MLSSKLKKYKYTPHRGLWMSPNNIQEVRKEIKAKIQKIGYRDIRRARLPLPEVLVKELYEDNCIEFAEYLETLLNKENILLSNKKIFKKFSENNDLLIILAENFHNADVELNVNLNMAKSLCIIYQMIQLIELNFSNYKWLSKECFEIILDLQSKHKELTNDEQEARFRYLYGKFCLESLFSYNDAIEQLEKAKNMSKGTTWLTAESSNDYLYKDCCYYLAQSYLAECDQYHDHDTNLIEAIKLTQAAILSLTESNSIDGEKRDLILYIEANLRNCQFLIKSSQYEETLKIHSNIQQLIDGSENSSLKCELYLQQAICYLWLDNLSLALNKLNDVVQLAETVNLLNFKGLALIEISKIYAKNNETFNLAQESLNEAKNIFELLKDFENSRKVNYLVAILKTQEILPCYVKLITSAGNSFCDMLKLHRWKNFLKPFWNESKEQKSNIACILKEMEYEENKNF